MGVSLILWFLAVFIIAGYVIGAARRVGVTESISASWYVLAHPRVFSWCLSGGSALMGMAVWLSGAARLEMLFASVMCLGLFGVGLVPQFKGADKESHTCLAISSGVACLALGLIIHPCTLLIPIALHCCGMLCLAEDEVDIKKCHLFIVENALLISGALFTAIIIGKGVCQW